MNFELILSLALLLSALCLAEEWQMLEPSSFPTKFQPLIFEGLCTDGTNFIMNTKYNIYVMNTELDIVSFELSGAIPDDLLQHGYNHLGDCAYSNGFIYYAVEEKSKTKPSIFVYNMTSSGISFYKQKSQASQSHMPWVAFDSATNLIYSSEYDNVKELMVYNGTSLEYINKLPIQGDMIPLSNVQGGSFYNGKLYLGVNGADSVFEIDVSTGSVRLAIQQVQPGNDIDEYEFEGLTFLDLRSQSKGLMHNTGNHHFHSKKMFHADLI